MVKYFKPMNNKNYSEFYKISSLGGSIIFTDLFQLVHLYSGHALDLQYNIV